MYGVYIGKNNNDIKKYEVVKIENDIECHIDILILRCKDAYDNQLVFQYKSQSDLLKDWIIVGDVAHAIFISNNMEGSIVDNYEGKVFS